MRIGTAATRASVKTVGKVRNLEEDSCFCGNGGVGLLLEPISAAIPDSETENTPLFAGDREDERRRAGLIGIEILNLRFL